MTAATLTCGGGGGAGAAPPDRPQPASKAANATAAVTAQRIFTNTPTPSFVNTLAARITPRAPFSLAVKRTPSLDTVTDLGCHLDLTNYIFLWRKIFSFYSERISTASEISAAGRRAYDPKVKIPA
jgi:hypothetical protein